MTRLTLIFFILISTLTMAQNRIEKTIGEFSELKVYDLIEVELVKSDKNKIVISGKNASDVLVNNKNGTLKIKMKFKEAFDGNKAKVVLHYTSVDIIDVNEGAKAVSKDIIKQFEIDFKAQEGGLISIPVHVSYINIKGVLGGVIKTSGSAKNQDILLLTGGVYHGETLVTRKTEITIKAAGEAHVNAKKLVDVKIRAGGDVFIYGNPDSINESRVFGGRVKKM